VPIFTGPSPGIYPKSILSLCTVISELGYYALLVIRGRPLLDVTVPTFCYPLLKFLEIYIPVLIKCDPI